MQATTLEKMPLDTLFIVAQLTSQIISVEIHRIFASCVGKAFIEMDFFYGDCFSDIKRGINLHFP